MKNQHLFVLLLICPLLLSGCLTAATGKTTIEISSLKSELAINESTYLTALIKENGKELVVDSDDITWQINDITKAKLDKEQGQQVTLTALASGTVRITAKYNNSISSTLSILILESDPYGEATLIFSETFDNVPNGTSIKNDPSQLDNPKALYDLSGNITINNGVAEMGSQRFALEIPDLANVNNPILKVTIKNDDGSGKPVSNLKLAVGNQYATGGAVGVDGYRAHGEHSITNSNFSVLEVELNENFTSTNLLNFRGIVGSSGTAGLFIDKIEVWDMEGSYIPPDPDPDPDPNPDPDPVIPTDPPDVIDDAYFGLVGWASENGGTTGGAGCPEDKILFIDNGRDLYDALYANERRHKGDSKYGDPYPLIIYITGKITPENTGEAKIDIKDQSDLSIIGYENLGEFEGIGISLRRSSNVIIRNLTIHHVNTGEKKGIDITTDSQNIWIDRCSFYSNRDKGKDYYDALVDVKEGAQYVTISWCTFADHYKTSLVGHTDNASKAPDKITYHHNYFHNVNSRTPLVRYAEVHMFNNYFHDISESGINVRMGGKVRVENNYFENVGNGNRDSKTNHIEGPIGWWYGSSETGYWEVIDNIFVNNPVNSYQSTTNVNIPYDYGSALNSAERAKDLVLQYAGAGSPSLDW